MTLDNSELREASGNVSLGIPPNGSFKFLVNGGRVGARASTSGSLGALLVSQNGTGPIATFRSNDTQVRAYLASGGNLGLGTTTPVGRLTVVSDSTENNQFYRMEDSNSGQKYFHGILENGNYVLFDFSAMEQRMVVKPSGEVGIGSTNPAGRLTVLGRSTENNQFYRMEDLDSSQVYFQGILDSGNYVLFHTNSDEQRMVLTPTGEVGFGATSPQGRVTVEGSSVENNQFLRIEDTDSGESYFQGVFSNGNYVLFSDTGNAQRITVTPTGEVGINTSNPSEALTVTGNICATGSITTCSDKRFKDNVKPIEGALDRVQKLEGVTFSWNEYYEDWAGEKKAEERQLGFIAQDVESVFPELVSKLDDGHRTLDYPKLTAVLVEAIKSQQAQIEELRSSLEQLKPRR